jgi:hypothetical protein
MMSASLFQSHPEKTVFVVGNGRSGTTMVGRVLGRHSAILAFEELHFFEQLWQPDGVPVTLSDTDSVKLLSRLLAHQRRGYYEAGDPTDFAAEADVIQCAYPDAQTAPQLFAAFLAYETARHNKRIACDQTPRNVYYLDSILELYDYALIVNIVRDPRDVLLSQKNRWRRRYLDANIPFRHTARVWAGYHPVTMSLLWRSGVRAGDAFVNHPRVHQLRFEDLVSQPRDELEALCAFLGVDFEPDMLNVDQFNSSHRSDRTGQTGIDASTAGRWIRGGLSNEEIWASQRLTATEMVRHGYEPRPVPLSPVGVTRLAILWLVKTPLALLLNLTRFRSLVSAFGKRLGLFGNGKMTQTQRSASSPNNIAPRQ